MLAIVAPPTARPAPAVALHPPPLADVVPPPTRGDIGDDVGADDATLGESPTLDAVLRVALARNPKVLAARARAEAAFAAVPGVGRLPDPQVKVEIWGAPLARPWALDDADTIMLGVRQSFPAPGVRGAETLAAGEEARAAAEELRVMQLEVIRDVGETWAAYVLADRGLAIHVLHIDVATTLVDTASSLIASGRTTLDDVLELDLERSRLHRDIARLQRGQRSAAVEVTTLMGRDPDAPLGPPPATDPEPRALPKLAPCRSSRSRNGRSGPPAATASRRGKLKPRRAGSSRASRLS